MGLGGVRDTLSDLFFPGTSTIQRRMRYFLFVPWCCEAALRDARGRSVLSELRAKEESLIRTLAHLGDNEGVIGLLKGEELVTMPGAIYWSGLRALNILKIPGSTKRWDRYLTERRRESTDEAPGEDDGATRRIPGFEHDLPPMPRDFPQTRGLNFQLTSDEARYLRRRISNATVGRNEWGLEHNLFAAFADKAVPPNTDFPWDHPRAISLHADTRHLLDIASAFSSVMYGATLLYNYLLCSRRCRDGDEDAGDWLERYRGTIGEWVANLREADLDLLKSGIHEIARIAPKVRHSVTIKTLIFVTTWIDIARDPQRLTHSKRAFDVVENRERELKGPLGTSRFANLEARKRWKYESGGRLTYRWAVARSYLNDIAAT